MDKSDLPKTKVERPPAFSTLKKILEDKAAASNSPFPDKADHDGLSGQLPKPNFQHINPMTINWQWNPVIGKATVESVYDKQNGTYDVTLILTQPHLTQDETKALGEALLSAWNWEHVWRQNAGDYLANDIGEEKDHKEERLCICPPNGWSPECSYGKHGKMATDAKEGTTYGLVE